MGRPTTSGKTHTRDNSTSDRKLTRIVGSDRIVQVKTIHGSWSTTVVTFGADRLLTPAIREEQLQNREYRLVCIECLKPHKHSAGCAIGQSVAHSKSASAKIDRTQTKLNLAPVAAGALSKDQQDHLQEAQRTFAGTAASIAKTKTTTTSTTATTTTISTTATTIFPQLSAVKGLLQGAEDGDDAEGGDDDDDEGEDDDDEGYHSAPDDGDEVGSVPMLAQEFTLPKGYVSPALTGSQIEDDDDDDGDDEEEEERDDDDSRVVAKDNILYATFENHFRPYMLSFTRHAPDTLPSIPPGQMTTVFSTVVPQPELLRWNPAFSDYCLTAEAHAYAGCAMILIDPALTHAQDLGGFKFRCTKVIPGKEQRCGNVLTRDQIMENFVIEKGFGKPRILRGMKYRCRGCPASSKNGGSTCHTTLSREMLDQLPPHLESTFAFVKVKGSVYSKEAVSFVKGCASGGIQFETLSKGAKIAKTETLLQNDLSRGYLIKVTQETLVSSRYKLPSVLENCIGFVKSLVPKAVHMKKLFTDTVGSAEALFQWTLAMNAVNSNGFSLDHFYPDGNKGTAQGSKAGLNVVDNIGRPVSSAAVVNKSLKDPPIQRLLSKISELNEGKAKVVFTDNHKVDYKVLGKAFQNAAISQDLFHFLQDLFKCVKKNHKHHSEWCGAVVQAVYVFNKDDVKQVHLELLAAKNKDADALVKDGSYLKRRKDVRRELVPDAKTFIARIDKVFLAFSKMGCFTKEILDLQTKINAKAESVFNLPKDYAQTMEIRSKLGKIIIRHLRGSNMTENLHLPMQRAETYRCGPDLTHCIFLMILIVRSRTLTISVLGEPLLSDAYDPELLNRVVELQSQLASFECFKVVDNCNLTKSLVRSDWLTDYRVPINSTTRAMPTVTKTKPTVVKGSRQADISPAPIKHKNEVRLLRLVARSSPKVYKLRKFWDELIDDDGNIRDEKEFYMRGMTEGFDKIFHGQQFCLTWNSLVSGAHQRAEATISVLNVTVDVTGIRCKEPAHFQTFFAAYGSGIQRNDLPVEVSSLMLATIAPASVPTLLPAAYPRIAVALPSPAICETVTTATMSGAKKRGLDHIDKQSDDDSGDELKKEKLSTPCPACNQTKHRAKKKLCEFVAWKESGKFVRQHGESKGQAAIRTWNEQREKQ